MKFFEKDGDLYLETSKGNLFVKNAWKLSDNKFHLQHGWYLYPTSLDLTKEFEIDIIDNSMCRIIKQL